MSKTIDTTVGIYETKYTLINHRDGTISVNTPYVNWTNNTGRLAFKNVKITKHICAIKDCFADYELSEISIAELINAQPQR